MITRLQNMARTRREAILSLLLLLLGLLFLANTPVGRSFLRNLGRTTEVRSLPGVSRLIGPVPPVYASSILGFRQPQGIAVTADASRLYVAEGSGERDVKIIDLRSRSVVGTMAPPGSTAGMRKPLNVAVGTDGTVYVADRLRLVVDMYSPEGAWLGVLADSYIPRSQWEPLGVGVSEKGHVYVTNANSGGPFVAEYDGSGRFQTTYGAPKDSAGGSLNFPYGVAVGPRGRIFVADSNNGRMAVLDEVGSIVQIYGHQAGASAMAIPRGIAIDRQGYGYVTDATGHEVLVWDLTTDPATYLFTFGEAGFADGEFQFPNAVAVDARGRIYIADTGNDRVQIWGY